MLLQKGSKGAEVVALQQLLNRAGGVILKTDGDYGPATETAVRNFQASVGIMADGVINDLTYQKLLDRDKATLLTTAGLKAIVPGMSDARVAIFTPALDAAMKEFQINTPRRVGMFIANMAHESAEFSLMVENLNYSAVGLATTWANRYGLNGKKGVPNALANQIARNPIAIANQTYANRMGNGGPESGDGWRYRGRCPIGITFHDNYAAAGKALGLDLVSCPELLEQPVPGCRAAAHFWWSNGINAYADKNDFDGACDKVNIGKKTDKVGDAIGFPERRKYWDNARRVFNLS